MSAFKNAILQHPVYVFIVLLCAIMALCTGCNSVVTESDTTKTYAADGKTLTQVVEHKKVTDKESPAAHKSWSTAGSVTALKLETIGSASSETVLPDVTIGGTSVAISSVAAMQSDESNPPTAACSASCGLLKSLFSMSAISYSFTYTGVKGETADDTAKRIDAIIKLRDSIASQATSTSSSK